MNNLECTQQPVLTESCGVTEPSAPDLAWEKELVQMLSALESYRASLQDDCAAGRTLLALETLLATAKGVAAFLRPRFEGKTPDALVTIQAYYDVFLQAARPLHKRLDDRVLPSLLRFLRFHWEAGDPNQQFLAAGRRLRDFLHAAFVLCARRFVSPAAAHSWTETYTVFIADLNDLFQPIES